MNSQNKDKIKRGCAQNKDKIKRGFAQIRITVEKKVTRIMQAHVIQVCCFMFFLLLISTVLKT